MTAPGPTPVTVVMVTHRSAELVGPVLDALLSDPEGPAEVVVVDSASPDATVEVLRRRGVTIIERADNVGFAAGCNLAAAEATQPYVAFLGHDTVPEHGWLPPLLAALDEPAVGAAMATIAQADRPDRFNTSGGHLGYHGLAWVSDLDEPIPPDESDPVEAAFPSGAAMAMRTEVWRRFEGFREDLFMYHEDVDLGWRLRLAGMRTVRVPASKVLHDYDFGRSPDKMYWLERNRRRLLASNWRPSTRALLWPALAAVDVGVAVVALRDGWFAQKRRAWRDARDRRDVHASARRRVARIRTQGDSVLLASMDSAISSAGQIRAPRGSNLVDRLLEAYRRMVLPVVRVLDRRAGLPVG